MTQPEALRLADWLLDWLRFNAEPSDLEAAFVGTAAELRRLYAVVQAREDECETHSAAVYEATRLLSETREQRDELLEALKSADETIDWLVLHLKQHHQCKHTDPTWSGIPRWIDKARAAIAKAEGKT